ncbi:MAG: signal peptidase I [Pseudomonadota bacterium]
MTSTSKGGWDNSSDTWDEDEIRPRIPSRAFLLSVCPGLGQQYAGHLMRGILLYTNLVIFSWLAAVAYMYVSSPLSSILLLSVPFIGVALIGVDAALCAKREASDYRLKWYNRYWIYAAVFLTLLATVNPFMDYIVGGRIVRAFFNTSDSMYPTILNRDLVVINKLIMPKRGDIALIEFGEKRKAGTITKVIKDQLLRRVIGIEGDTIEIQGNQVFLNGNVIDEAYVSYADSQSLNVFMESDYKMESVVVPSNSFFVLADARHYSFDSRIFGMVNQEEIGGVATKVFWSWNLDEGSFKWNRTAMSLM